MANLAQTQLFGNVVKQPTMLHSVGQTSHVVVRIAVNYRYRTNAGNWVDKTTSYIDVHCWGNLADNVIGSGLTKGTGVIVIGRIETREYESKKQDAEGKPIKHTAINVVASHIGPDLNFVQVKVHKFLREDPEEIVPDVPQQDSQPSSSASMDFDDHDQVEDGSASNNNEEKQLVGVSAAADSGSSGGKPPF